MIYSEPITDLAHEPCKALKFIWIKVLKGYYFLRVIKFFVNPFYNDEILLVGHNPSTFIFAWR